MRQSYLSTSLPPARRTQLSRTDSSLSTKKAHSHPEKSQRYLTDPQRDQIDAESKQLLRELNASIRSLSDAETLRQETETILAQRRRAKHGLGGVLGRWAAGSDHALRSARTPAEEVEDVQQSTFKMHRESVLWYLRRKLSACGSIQASMMETRLVREVERSKSVLYKTHGVDPSLLPQSISISTAVPAHLRPPPTAQISSTSRSSHSPYDSNMSAAESSAIESQLTPEQLQLFATENQSMLTHYQTTLDQVRTAERSLLEISELQTTLVDNLATQGAHIDQLVADSIYTTANVGGGNKQLKRATERRSTARMVFWGTCVFAGVLVGWDLLI